MTINLLLIFKYWFSRFCSNAVGKLYFKVTFKAIEAIKLSIQSLGRMYTNFRIRSYLEITLSPSTIENCYTFTHEYPHAKGDVKEPTKCIYVCYVHLI